MTITVTNSVRRHVTRRLYGDNQLHGALYWKPRSANGFQPIGPGANLVYYQAQGPSTLGDVHDWKDDKHNIHVMSSSHLLIYIDHSLFLQFLLRFLALITF